MDAFFRMRSSIHAFLFANLRFFPDIWSIKAKNIGKKVNPYVRMTEAYGSFNQFQQAETIVFLY